MYIKNIKGCESKELVKNGISLEGRRSTNARAVAVHMDQDNRLKYIMKKRIMLIKMYLKGVVRYLERIEDISSGALMYITDMVSSLIRKEINCNPIFLQLYEFYDIFH